MAFVIPKDGRNVRPGFADSRRRAAFTTRGASCWLTRMTRPPCARTLTRGVRAIRARGSNTRFAAHDLMDGSTPASRAAYLSKVAAKTKRMTA